ncbi:hypothetical protein NDU88_003452 [Pleurodeles waltl]|uniref:Uncharacterized protein n=1 Tax=Pleurodeles waltl TaxID=8319 RepID=A0AAV7NI84_PLEWA|nr:hypothetical protein NDU88_003452 [Pleurodeles waltl]
MSLACPHCTDRLITVTTANWMAFSMPILRIMAKAPELLGQWLQLRFCAPSGRHHDVRCLGKVMLCFKAVEVGPEYGVLLATHQADAMWTCIIFVMHRCSVQEVNDYQMFSGCPGASETIFADFVKVKIELLNGAPSSMTVLTTVQEHTVSAGPPQLWANGPFDVELINTTQPVKITLQEGAFLPWVYQFLLSREDGEGIADIIQALVDQVVVCVLPCNTHIFMVEK